MKLFVLIITVSFFIDTLVRLYRVVNEGTYSIRAEDNALVIIGRMIFVVWGSVLWFSS